ncbi:MAG TPA: indole-3-glycerol phosphate synthase TrpC [Longimicrobiales bacterium]|nr:indole-3-glycerol phosphate synthase TrpC [Longimicrobiales bacterium]
MNRNARGSVLDRIVETKQAEVARLRREAVALRAAAEASEAAPDFEAALRAGAQVAVIAEVKRRSPSAGDIRVAVAAVDVARTYAAGGAAAISVLTDREHFGGSLDDLRAVVADVGIAVLRKDFTIDALQVYEARAAGAAAVLLIARILDDAELSDFAALAAELRLAALVEVHDEYEVERALKAGARIVGVNNRDLATFTTDLAATQRLAPLVPRECLLVAESGIATAADVRRVAQAGAGAVLVGEALMRAPDPAALLGELGSIERAQ